MSGPNWELDEDLQTVTVTFPTDPPVALKLDAQDVEDILSNLGEFRARMNPAIPRDFLRGQSVGAIHDPGWVSEPDALAGDSLLHVRDPRFGWLHYLIPREEARKLAEFLQSQVAAPPPGQGSVKPN